MGFTASPPSNTPLLAAGGGVSLPWLAWFGGLSKPTWSSWIPSVTASGSMTVSGVSITLANFIQNGPAVTFSCTLSFTLGGTAAPEVHLTLPIPAAGFTEFTPLSASGTPAGGAQQLLLAFVSAPGTDLLIRLNPLANWPLGIQAGIRVAGTYQCG